ncbi:MurR/RpiR family transcriptional regulator [uncultured Vagococcus sp.]|uniref:MurR/RpiR family transcriptional regulator n=1 Tax=uncultured Vagococcus sp. TaxID=189676 RepID=UPI0028D3F830|nr:MurR/RpiR family transcriptional regulator [uncultured Vagococcus sp.]
MYFYELLKKNRHLLNSTEEDVLQSLLNQAENIKSLTIRQIATENYTVPNTVTRLCQKLGFKGFSDFREALYLTTHEKENVLTLTSLDEQIIRTKQLINPQVIKEILGKIHNAQRIVFFAVGLSRFPAEELNERFKILGINSHTFIDPHVMKHNAKLLTKNDLAIAISVSGTTDTILAATTIASVKGATTLSITGFSHNPIAALTDYQLYGMVSPASIEGIDTADRFSLHYLTNLLFNDYLTTFYH